MIDIVGLPFFIPTGIKETISTVAFSMVVACLLMVFLHVLASSFGREACVGLPAHFVDHQILWFSILSVIIIFGLMVIFKPWSQPSPAAISSSHTTISRETVPIELEAKPRQTPDHRVVVKPPNLVDVAKDNITPPLKAEDSSPSPSNHEVIVDAPHKPKTRVFTPRTPKELMDMAITKTKRDAMRHKGAWIHVEGTVLNISEVQAPRFDITKKRYIEIEVEVGSLPNNRFPQTVKLYVDSDEWKPQVDKIERGDHLVAIGIVHNIYKLFVEVNNGEIVSVSGPDGDRR